MDSKSIKPKLTSEDLIKKMKSDGISFNYMSEKEAVNYLTDKNNYFRTASYRKNYQKYLNGENKGKYINLDFSYLKELSTIDMHLRFLILKMCLDIEHDLKVQLLKYAETDSDDNGYVLVKSFLERHSYIIQKLELNSSSPFTGDLTKKYFSICQKDFPESEKIKITGYDNCPIWVFSELLSFGDFIKFYTFYYSSKGVTPKISFPVINLVKSLRNGAAHNNCILHNLLIGTSYAPVELKKAVAKMSSINSNQRKKKLSCRPMLEFTALLYAYNTIVSEEVKFNRTEELKKLFFERMIKNQDFFITNELIKSNYKFACCLIKEFFP